MRRRILLVEDEPRTRETIALYLEREGYDVATADDGVRALEVAREQEPHLVVLDLMLPRMDGLEVCRRLREEGNPAVIMVTARSTEEDKLTGLDLGADDYVTKPFSPRELMARIRAVLRRAAEEDSIEAGSIAVDRLRREVTVEGALVAVTPTEFRLLEALMRAAGRTFTRQELVTRALGEEYDGLDRTVDVHVMNLRKKLGEAGKAIVTVFGVGYRFAK
ncbi:MAG: two-component system, OmpR family, alkaline phosphatase synthesis response regulator PhoP [Acidobacteriota bacterium]|jgi:DNA-binding response OmpR family regulator|nr:two-component system, OmpR family, alkaline phosphatase synthesis response regulator PhoP [Acidobacteriota bacterium]